MKNRHQKSTIFSPLAFHRLRLLDKQGSEKGFFRFGERFRRKFSGGFLEGVLQWVVKGKGVLRRVLRRGSFLEGRLPEACLQHFVGEYGPRILGVCPNGMAGGVSKFRSLMFGRISGTF